MYDKSKLNHPTTMMTTLIMLYIYFFLNILIHPLQHCYQSMKSCSCVPCPQASCLGSFQFNLSSLASLQYHKTSFYHVSVAVGIHEVLNLQGRREFDCSSNEWVIWCQFSKLKGEEVDGVTS